MSLSWSEIKETILQNYEVGYSRKSILNSVNTIVKTWGRDYVEKYPKNTVWNIAHLIDQGLIINELKGLAGSELLFVDSEKRNEPHFLRLVWPAFSLKKDTMSF